MVFHIVTDALPPTKGGLEIWTHDFANYLTYAGHIVIAYTIEDVTEFHNANTRSYEICNLADLRCNWQTPLLRSGRVTERVKLEIWRLNFLLLRSEIRKRLVEHQSIQHLLFSNFAVTAGYLAMLVSQDLSMPHIATFVGTDFSRGFRNSQERALICEICATARHVICKSEEQAKGIRFAFSPKRLTVIPTSVAWFQRDDNCLSNIKTVRLFSDCGLSYHKGTQVLVQSVVSLLSEGFPIHLTLCGAASSTEISYWDGYTEEMLQKAQGDIELMGYVTQDRIKELLLDASIYCSATLGEGSSAARLSALCSGIPIVTTRCGEFVHEIENDISHVFLSEPGDAEGFKSCMRDATKKLLSGELIVDRKAVANWQNRFSHDNEFLAWSNLLGDINII